MTTTIGNRLRRHTCHAMACEVRVPPKMFMCRVHWYKLTAGLRQEVWAAYVEGQEERMDPSPEYLEVAQRAVDYVARKEGRID